MSITPWRDHHDAGAGLITVSDDAMLRVLPVIVGLEGGGE
jgi:hypothetical protein